MISGHSWRDSPLIFNHNHISYLSDWHTALLTVIKIIIPNISYIHYKKYLWHIPNNLHPYIIKHIYGRAIKSSFIPLITHIFQSCIHAIVCTIWSQYYTINFLNWFIAISYIISWFDGLVQERRNSSALTMELHLPCTKPTIDCVITRGETIRYCHDTLHISIQVSRYDFDTIHIIYAIFFKYLDFLTETSGWWSIL